MVEIFLPLNSFFELFQAQIPSLLLSQQKVQIVLNAIQFRFFIYQILKDYVFDIFILEDIRLLIFILISTLALLSNFFSLKFNS